MNYKHMNSTDPSTRIIASAWTIGTISFVAGFVGPLLMNGGNLGPLLGIFVTGPIGTLVGALVGLIRSAVRAGSRPIWAELRWLAAVWVACLAYSWAYAFIGIGFIPLSLQVAVVGSGAFLLFHRGLTLPATARRGRPLIVAAGVLTIAASIVPPISPSDTGTRVFAFFLDPRFTQFDRNGSVYMVDRTGLVQEWLFIAVVAAMLIFGVEWWIGLRGRSIPD